MEIVPEFSTQTVLSSCCKSMLVDRTCFVCVTSNIRQMFVWFWIFGALEDAAS